MPNELGDARGLAALVPGDHACWAFGGVDSLVLQEDCRVEVAA